MNSLIQAWLVAETKMREAQEVAEQALEDAETAKPPKNLRPATARDIVEDAIIWYPKRASDGDGCCWHLVYEVLRPSDEWKAYSDQHGCRYGLSGAFVEVE